MSAPIIQLTDVYEMCTIYQPYYATYHSRILYFRILPLPSRRGDLDFSDLQQSQNIYPIGGGLSGNGSLFASNILVKCYIGVF